MYLIINFLFIQKENYKTEFLIKQIILVLFDKYHINNKLNLTTHLKIYVRLRNFLADSL